MIVVQRCAAPRNHREPIILATVLQRTVRRTRRPTHPPAAQGALGESRDLLRVQNLLCAAIQPSAFSPGTRLPSQHVSYLQPRDTPRTTGNNVLCCVEIQPCHLALVQVPRQRQHVSYLGPGSCPRRHLTFGRTEKLTLHSRSLTHEVSP